MIKKSRAGDQGADPVTPVKDPGQRLAVRGGASLAVHVAASQYDRLPQSCFVTAERLASVLSPIGT